MKPASASVPVDLVAKLGAYRLVVLIAAGLLGPSACADTDTREYVGAANEGGSQGSADTFTQHFEILGDLVLEEAAEVLNVTPQVRVGTPGELLIADRAEHQVRSYSEAGHLRWYLRHPAVNDPAVAVRVSDGVVLVADVHSGAALIYAGDGTVTPRSGPSVRLPPELGTVDDLDVIADSLVLYSARPGEKQDPTDGLHVIDPQTGRVVRSFFQPYLSPTVADLARVAGWIKSSVRGDTIASLFAPCDTIFLHSADGVALQRIPLPTQSFHLVDRPRRPNEGLKDWTAGVSFASDIYWLPSGNFVVLFSEFEHNLPHRHLLAITRGGERLFEIDSPPRLHAVLPSGVILFSSPTEIATNHLVVTRMR